MRRSVASSEGDVMRHCPICRNPIAEYYGMVTKIAIQ
jgi:hypothetical protein